LEILDNIFLDSIQAEDMAISLFIWKLSGTAKTDFYLKVSLSLLNMHLKLILIAIDIFIRSLSH